VLRRLIGIKRKDDVALGGVNARAKRLGILGKRAEFIAGRLCMSHHRHGPFASPRRESGYRRVTRVTPAFDP
jgi:hypothetical protein